MSKALDGLKGKWLLVAFVIMVAVLIIQRGLPKWHSEDPRFPDYVPGTVEHPSSMNNSWGATFQEKGKRLDHWRDTHLWRVIEAPLADGYTDGRCFIELGAVFGGWVRDAPNEDRTLTIAYAANGVILATGEPDLPCNAQTIEHSLELPPDDTAPLADVVSADGGEDARRWVHVTYVLGDAEPDAVVMTDTVPDAGDRVPGHSEVVAFQLTRPWYEQFNDAWNGIFGLKDDGEEGA